jgi:hypothetical protein
MEFYDAIDVELVNQPKGHDAIAEQEYREMDLENEEMLFKPKSSLQEPEKVP